MEIMKESFVEDGEADEKCVLGELVKQARKQARGPKSH
jgi:hypothetical protein